MADGKTLRFEALFNGVQVVGTALAHNDQVTLIPAPNQVFEIKLDVFEALMTRLVISAHSQADDS